MCPPNNFGGTTYNFATLCPAVVASWNSGVMDTTRNRLILWGGGHTDYAGNEFYAVNLDDLSIQRLNNPAVPTNAGGSCTVTTLADGTPNSRHTYDGIAYMAQDDKMFVFGGSPTCVTGGFTNDTWVFDFATLAWQRKNPTGTIPAAVPGIVTAYDPATDRVLLHDDWNLYSYDLAADRYTRLATDNIDYHLSAVIDPVRRQMVLIGNGQAWSYDIGTGSSYVRQALATTGGSAVVGSLYPGLAYDPVSGHIIGWSGGDTVYSLDLSTGAWTPSTFAGGPGPAQPNGTYKRWNYSPASGVFVLVNAMTQNAYALRLGAVGPTDTTPDPFSFAAQTGVAPNATVTSGGVTIAGINAPAPVSIAGGTYSVDGGGFGSAAATLTNGATVSVRLIAAAGAGVQTCATLTVGGVAAQFCATTQPAAGPTTPGTTFTLLAPAAQTFAPFTIGLGFRKGDVITPVLDIPDFQVVVMRRWNDGSVKHAIASGHVALTAGVAKTIAASQSSTQHNAVNLTTAAIVAANPQASVDFGAAGSVNLSSLLATPFRTFVSGPEMIEAHYRGQPAGDPTLTAWFHVRLYKGGRIWIRAIADNGFLDLAGQNRTYVPAVSIGGTTIWNNGGAPLTHYANTRWTQEGWIGGDPQVTPQLDTAYLKSARLVPNFLAATADPAALNALYQSYAPNQSGNWTPAMGDTGYQDQIGLLPAWDALYVASAGDPRAYRAVIANAKALNSYPIAWSDSVTRLPVKPSDRPNWSVDGPDAGGSTSRVAGALTWEIAHHGSGGYLAYLITGDYFHLETMQNQAATAYLMAGPVDWTATPAGTNLGTSRYFNGQTRGYAWTMRTLSQYVAIAPAGDGIAADYGALLANNIRHLKALKDTVLPAGTGYVYEYDASLYGAGLVAPWQQHFFTQALGMGSDLEPLADMSAYNEVRDYLYRGAVGILGDGSGYCFTQAGVYNLKSNAGTGIAANTWYKTWAQVYAATFATPPACLNTLAGTSGSDPALAARGYWGVLLPAIAYAVDHGAAGAGAAWTRLTGATNWNGVLQSGFEQTPTWGVVPRAPVIAAPDSVPDPFTFAFQSGVAVNSIATSDPITVTGIDAPAAIGITAGSYSAGGAAFTSTAGLVAAGDAVRVRLATSPGNGTQTCATLTIGGVSAPFCATTLDAAADTTPNPFSFAELYGAAPNATVTSAPVTIAGINAPASVSVAGGSYSVNGGGYTAQSATVGNGDILTVRLTTAATGGTRSCATLTVGAVTGPFCATTLVPADLIPDPFAFAPTTAAAPNTSVTSNAITVTGISAPAPIAIAGGTYSIDGGGFGSSAGSVNAGSQVRVRLTASGVQSAQVCATLTIGGIAGAFCVTTTAATQTPQVLDVDDNGTVDALTDGLLTLRYLFGLTGTALIHGAIGDGARRTDPVAIIGYLDGIRAQLDVDGDLHADALTDGLMLIRYLFGLRGAPLVNGVIGSKATRTTTEIQDYIQSMRQ